MTIGRIIADPKNYKNINHVGLDISENVKNLQSMISKHPKNVSGYSNIRKIIPPNVNLTPNKSVLTFQFNQYFTKNIHQNIPYDVIDNEFENLLFDLKNKNIKIGDCYFNIIQSMDGESLIIVTITINHIA